MNYPTGDSWLPWQRDYRYGALVIEPPRQLAAALDPIRARLDPISAGRVGAHITLTPPFADAPSGAQEERVASTVRGQTTVGLQLGRPTVFSGSSVIYLPVEPRREFDSLRAVLLATGLFRLDLPHTDDFVPHLTLSEFGTSPTSPEEIDVPEPQSMFFLVEAISWLVPDQGFHFTMRRTFPLGPVPLREDETTFRRAVPDDGPTIAEVHARSWPWTYDGLLPAEVIAGVVGEREARGMRLRDAIADESTGQRVWVATREGAVVGFATWSPSQDDDATDTTAEVGAIYLDPAVVGQGVGRGLLERVVDELTTAGFTDATLWVLRSNTRARRFYEAAGWSPDGTGKVVQLPGGVLDEVRYRLQRKL